MSCVSRMSAPPHLPIWEQNAYPAEMSFLPADQRELYLPLVEGIHESPPWGLFLRNLVARTYARHAFLVITLANSAPDQEPTAIHATAPRASEERPLDYRKLDTLRLHPYGALRPGRVYGLDEMLNFDNPTELARQKAGLDEMGIRYGRWLRVSASGVADAWLVLVRYHEDFSASAVASMTAIAPHLTAALRTLAALIELRLQATMAQGALARLGVGQIAFDASARVMAADPMAERLLSFATDPDGAPGRRLRLPPKTARALEGACAALAPEKPDSREISALVVDEPRDIWMVLRRWNLPLGEPHAAPAVLGTLRHDLRENAWAAAHVLQQRHGLSLREAQLAHALSLGESIIEAGERLQLTPETARNYSKRIYAKTGTSGQADLVRLLLTGLVPFA